MVSHINKKTPQNDQIKVMHCAETIKGGVATYLNQLVPLQFKDSGFHEIYLLVPESQKEYLTCANDCILSGFVDSQSRLRSSFSLAISAFRLLKKSDIEIIHLHSTFSGLIIRPMIFLFLFRKVRVVYCPHGWAWDRNYSFFTKRLIVLIELILGWITDRVVCISEHEYISASQNFFTEKKLILIQNGIDLSGDKKNSEMDKVFWPHGSLKLLYVGRLDYQKGVDILFDAINVLGDKVFLKVAGSTVLSPRYQGLNSMANVEMLGWLDSEELYPLYSTADALLVPSRWEGFGLVAIEAMKYGLPVLASRVGGLSNVVDDGITGILFEPNSAEKLILAVLKLLESDRSSMGMAGKKRVFEKFNIDRVHNETLLMYRNLLV